MKKLFFAYCLHVSSQHRRGDELGHLCPVDRAVLPGFRLSFSHRGRLTLEPCPGSRAPGVLFEAGEDDWRVLDLTQRSRGRRRQAVWAWTYRGGAVEAVAYVSAGPRDLLAEPSLDYLTQLLSGYEENRLDPEALRAARMGLPYRRSDEMLLESGLECEAGRVRGFAADGPLW